MTFSRRVFPTECSSFFVSLVAGAAGLGVHAWFEHQREARGAMRVVLFDIDGTLLLTDRAGQQAMNEVATGKPESNGETTGLAFSGRTDRAIISDYLRILGLPDTEDHFRDFCDRFCAALPRHLLSRRGYVLPGVHDLLQRMSRVPGLVIGLLTGNLRRAAQAKLTHYGLDHYFYRHGQPVGAFGDDHADRNDVARSALADLTSKGHESLRGEDIWIIGDTPLDVRCARSISANVLAVATGSYSLDILQESGADVTLSDLTQAEVWWKQVFPEEA